MFITGNRITGTIPIKKGISQFDNPVVNQAKSNIKTPKSYREQIAESFLGLNGFNMTNLLNMHLSSHKLRRFIPFVFETAKADKEWYKTISKPSKGKPKVTPAFYFLENASAGEIQRILENNRYTLTANISYGSHIKSGDEIAELCEDGSVVYDHRLKSIYGFDSKKLCCTTEGMSINKFMDYCEEEYTKLNQEFFDSIPGFTSRIKNVKEQTSMLTGAYTVTVAETFSIPKFIDFISKVIENTSIPEGYELQLRNVNPVTMNISHRVAVKKIKDKTFGKVYATKEGNYVTPQISKNGTVLQEVYLLAHNTKTDGIDYIPLQINNESNLKLNNDFFRYKDNHIEESMLNFDNNGIPTKESVLKYFMVHEGDISLEDLHNLNAYFEFHSNGEGVTEDAVTATRKVVHAARDVASKAGGVISTVKRSAEEVIRPIADKIDDTMANWNKYKDDESKRIVIANSTVAKMSRFFRQVVAPTMIGFALKGTIGGIVAFLISMYHKSDDTETKKKILHELEEELKIVREKIDDAKSDGAREDKYRLMRIESKLEKEIAKIRTQDIK